MKQLRNRSEVTVGAVVGAILTLAIAGSLDLFIPLGEGGWSESIRKTILRWLGHPWDEVLALQIAVGISAILVLIIAGAMIGAVFGVLISGFFRKMYGLIDKHEKE